MQRYSWLVTASADFGNEGEYDEEEEEEEGMEGGAWLVGGLTRC